MSCNLWHFSGYHCGNKTAQESRLLADWLQAGAVSGKILSLVIDLSLLITMAAIVFSIIKMIVDITFFEKLAPKGTS